MTTRMYGRWEKPRSAGFFGLTWGVSMLGLGLVIAIMLIFMVTHSLSVTGIAICCAAAIFVPMAVTIGGRTGWEIAVLRIQFALARSRGELEYRSGRFSSIPGTARLPGLLADSWLTEYETPGGKRFGLIHVRRTDHYTVVLRVIPRGRELVDQTQIDDWVSEYGNFLASQSRGGEVVAVTSVLDTVVETHLRQHREVARLLRPQAPEFARAVMREAAADIGGVGVRVEARVALTYRAIGRGRGRRDIAEQAREISQRLQARYRSWRVPGCPRRRWKRGKCWDWCGHGMTWPPSVTSS
nr:SCO6880 family protein [Nocardia terpenica]